MRRCSPQAREGAAGLYALSPEDAGRVTDGASRHSAFRQPRPPRATATEVAPGILWLRLPLPMALDHVNVYALDDGDGWTIVDTGLATRRSQGDLGGAAGRAACGPSP